MSEILVIGSVSLDSLRLTTTLAYEQTDVVRRLFEEADLFFLNENEACGLFGSLDGAQTAPGKLLFVTLAERGADLRRMLPSIPADRLLIETDAPYLTPEPEKRHHRRNEPAFVRSVLLKLAAVRHEDPSTLAEQVWRNTCRLYGEPEEG